MIPDGWAKLLRSGPWRRAHVRLFGAFGLFAGVAVAAAMATMMTTTRPLITGSLGAAALNEDLRACPATVGLMITRSILIGAETAGDRSVIQEGPDPIDLAGASRAVSDAVVPIAAVSRPIVTVFGGDGQIEAGGRSAVVQLLARDDVDKHIAVLGGGSGPGAWLSEKSASSLGLRVGDRLTVKSGAGEISTVVRGMFVDLQENRAVLVPVQGSGRIAKGRYILLYMEGSLTSLLVQQLRDRAGVSQTELAERSGVAQSAISDYERGRKEPALSTLQRLAASVNLDLNVFYTPTPSAKTLASLRRRRRAILEVCRRHGASNPRVFGSTAKGTARPDSDIDLLVDLESGRTLFDVAALHDDLESLLGRDVDVLTRGSVKGRLAHVADEAVPI